MRSRDTRLPCSDPRNNWTTIRRTTQMIGLLTSIAISEQRGVNEILAQNQANQGSEMKSRVDGGIMDSEK